ncbi:MAG: T9SS type A sorting domain-containing protein [Lentimicrobiaceae bacterium]|nr:T9SS type A sorting domain-containing protein [Lentimicrobiaceae bacterium]
MQTILADAKPDVLTVNEFGAKEYLITDFLNNNLNINGVKSWKSTPIINQAGSNIINCIFYDTTKARLKSHKIVQTYVRDIDAYEMYAVTPDLANGDTITFVCIVGHLKAGNTPDDATKRNVMVENTMRYIAANHPSDNIMFMGDFNFYSASEAAYQLMLNYSNADARLLDPIDQEGEWHDNVDYAKIFTQSTNTANGCASSGGMDDRFDFIMISDEIRFGTSKMIYVQESYKAFGQDGIRLNKSITNPTNNSVSQEVAEALQQNSDHLPIVLKLIAKRDVGVNEFSQESLYASIYPNPIRENTTLSFKNNKSGKIRFEIIDLQGQTVFSDENYFDAGAQNYQIETAHLRNGFYLLQLTNSNNYSEVIKMIVR